MRIIKYSTVLFLCLLWIFITNYKVFPISDIGSLLTYKSGLLGLQSEDQIDIEVGIGKDLLIKIDSIGIPYIYSSNDNDLAYGLGYMHAKDRYFQMELMARIVKGELSEILGVNTFLSDESWKPLEFDRKSKEQLEEYRIKNPELYSYLVHYSEGVNAFLEKNQPNDPLYKIFNLKPQKWQPENCFLVAWYMSSNLAFFDYHVERQELLDKLPKELLAVLYPQQFEDIKTILPSKKFEERVIDIQPLEKLGVHISKETTSVFNTDIGSNNWALNSEKANGNAPLIVNDPHLSLTLPGAFYEASLQGDKLKVYGYSIPGSPLIVSGHNTDVSWGITNGEWDLVDRYLLKTKKDSLYFYEGNWIPFQEKQYTIKIRGVGEEQIKIKKTVHGFVKNEDSLYYAQKWYPSGKNQSIKAIYDVMQSKNYSQFKKALQTYDYPPQNFIYADVNDSIGIVCAGKLPKRPQGFQGGLLDGTKTPLKEEFISTQWETSNPQNGYLFSANQLPIQNNNYFGAHWHKDDYRVTHIDNLLKEKSDWNIQEVKSMQLDEVDISFFHLKEVFENNSNVDEKYNDIKEVLSNWDGTMNSSSQKAFLYETLRKCVEEEAKRFANEELGVQQTPSMKSFLNYLSAETSFNGQYSSRDTLINNILKKTDSILSVENQSGERKYNHISTINIYNIASLPGFGHTIIDAGGNKNTINMNASAYPVFRSIYEMEKDNIKGYTIMAGGQSGKVNSKNYTNQLEDWKIGNYKETQFSENPEELKNIISTISFE